MWSVIQRLFRGHPRYRFMTNETSSRKAMARWEVRLRSVAAVRPPRVRNVAAAAVIHRVLHSRVHTAQSRESPGREQGQRSDGAEEGLLKFLFCQPSDTKWCVVHLFEYLNIWIVEPKSKFEWNV